MLMGQTRIYYVCHVFEGPTFTHITFSFQLASISLYLKYNASLPRSCSEPNLFQCASFPVDNNFDKPESFDIENLPSETRSEDPHSIHPNVAISPNEAWGTTILDKVIQTPTELSLKIVTLVIRARRTV